MYRVSMIGSETGLEEEVLTTDSRAAANAFCEGLIALHKDAWIEELDCSEVLIRGHNQQSFPFGDPPDGLKNQGLGQKGKPLYRRKGVDTPGSAQTHLGFRKEAHDELQHRAGRPR